MYNVYLAGPEVFLPESLCSQVAKDKKAICEKYGVAGLFPTDTLPDDIFSDNYNKQEQSRIIRAACIDSMHKADAVVANITPFRGPSADAGTVFEIGFMAGLGKQVFLYSNCSEIYKGKVGSDDLDMIIEDFSLVDNLMFGLTEAFDGFDVADAPLQGTDMFTDTVAFEKAIQRLAHLSLQA